MRFERDCLGLEKPVPFRGLVGTTAALKIMSGGLSVVTMSRFARKGFSPAGVVPAPAIHVHEDRFVELRTPGGFQSTKRLYGQLNTR